MVALFRPMILAAVAFYGSAQGQPASKADRQMNIDVSPVADYVVVDPIGEYMRSTTLGDGTIIGGYVALDGTDANLRVVRSGDGGDSWEQIATVDGGPIAEKEINNAFPLVLADGRILYAFRNHDKLPEGGFSIYRITLYESKDSGVTWSFLSQIDERIPDGLNGLWEPFLRETGDGTIQAYYSAENSDTDQDNLMRASTDGGATWGDIINVSGGDVESRDGMTGVTAIDDGTLM